MAVVVADTPTHMCFCYNVPREVTIFDRGRKRSDSDSLIMSGMDSKLASTFCIAIAKLVLSIERSETVFAHNEIEKFLDENKDNLLKIRQIVATASKRDGEVNTRCAPFGAACFYAINAGVSVDTITRFERIVRKGFAENANESAAIVCRNNIISKAIYVGGGATARKKAVFQICKAIKDFANKEPRKKTYLNWEDKVYLFKKSAPTDKP